MKNENRPQNNEQNLINPFPSTAVARLAIGARELLTIETEALKQIKSHVHDYIEREDDYGKTICIVGEYGTGKTHLVLEILNIIEESGDKTLHPFYLDAPSDNFLELYRKRFLPKLSPALVLERLDECYADVVAAELKKNKIYSEISAQIENREINAFDVVKKIGLMESRLQRQFQKRLKHITEDPCFSMALTLFQQPEFEHDIWEWFNGKTPNMALKERGITKTINTDALALETIGILAFLFGQQGHRFILLIDELEKVFSSTKHFPDETAMLAFKKLFEAIGKTKALLVLSGLPDFYEALPSDARERISIVIKPSALTGEDVVAYIRKANKKATNKNILRPFSTDTAKYISTLTGGNARKVVRICYHAFQNALIENKEITRQTIEEIVQEQFGGQLKEDIHFEILQVIERRGWISETEKIFEKNKKQQKADFWIPIGEESDGISITLVQDIFSKEDCKQIIDNTTFLREEDEKGIKRASVLVVGGYLAENLTDGLNDAFHRVMPYKLRHFRNDLDSVLTGLRVRIEERAKEDDITVIKEKLNQLDRQYRSLRDIIHELPTKENLLTSIQFGFKMSSDTTAPISVPIEITSVFHSTFILLNEFDSIITQPFYDSYFMGIEKRPSFEILYMREGFDSLGQFYLLREMVYLFYDLIVFPDKFERIRTSLLRLDVERICRSFDTEIMSPLLDSNKFRDIRRIINYIQDYTSSFRDTIGSDVMDLDLALIKLEPKLRELPHDIYQGREDSIHKRKAQGQEALRSYTADLRNEQIVTSLFPELNSVFLRTSAMINSVDQMIKEEIIYRIFIQNSDLNILFDSEKGTQQLANFYFLKKMVFLFMNVINRNISFQGGFSRRYNRRLFQFCEIFDSEILRRTMKRSLRLHRVFEIFEDSKYRRSLGFYPEDMMIYSKELEKQIYNLGRNTFKALDKIISTYRRDYDEY
jgi:hypothetical protein